jgi:hypothetical protein
VAWAQVNVWTHRYDNARTGSNLAETQLNTSNVNPNQFGKLFSYAVDGDIYTQPLVIRGVSIPGKGTHNVVYVATNNNGVYAFDADNNLGANSQALWYTSFNGPAITPVPAADMLATFIPNLSPIGIMGTPVIDQSTQTMYLVARTKETSGSNVAYRQRLHALDISTGAEKFGGPVLIQASVSGVGYDSVGGVVTFNPLKEHQRVGLALANGNVYIAWASAGDSDPYHGWVIAYNATTLQQIGALCVTPDGQRAGIWQSGQPLSIDASGNLYVATGNGTFDGVRNFGESILKLNANLSSVLDWFTPDNWSFLNSLDLDLGSAGVLLLPGTNDLVGAGKEGRLYLLNRGSLGHTQVGNGQIVQTFQITGGGNIHGAPAFWNGPSGPWVYVWGEQDNLKAFAFDGSVFNTTPISQSINPAPPGMPGGFLTISANGSQAGSAILWASIPYAEDANIDIVSGVLRAFDATDLTRELWNTRMVPARDDLGNFAKFVPPTIANGRVYLASFSSRLHVYGPLGSVPPQTGGALTGTGTASTAAVDLTATGIADWAHWPSFDDKGVGAEQISDYAFLGPAPNVYSNDPRTFTWGDGTPTACGSSAEGVAVSGTNNGFLITVPADTANRTLTVYVGGSNSRGMLTAHLSDGSAPDFVDTGFSSTGQYDAVYTLSYHAASAGQELTVMWTLFSGSGNVSLQGAGLVDASSSATPSGCAWVEDGVPAGASTVSAEDGWSWVRSDPAPYAGLWSHQSGLQSGFHQHYFQNAASTLTVGVGESLFSYVYLDPANPPSELMLQWNDGSWEHRAYWGANLIAYGPDGTASQRNMGPLPPTGQWVLLQVPAALLGLEGRTLSGMSFTLYDGRATWDHAGKAAAQTTFQVIGAVTLGGAALSGVSFAATGGGSCANSDGIGHYACTVAQGWSGTITPALGGYIFTPAARGYSNVAADQTAQDYAAAAGSTTTALASSLNPSIVGSSVTFTATVTGSAPSGTVGFTDGGSTISACSAVALPAGSVNTKTASCSSGLAAGTHSIVATYSGDAANSGSTSASLSQVVNAGGGPALVNSSFEIPALGSGYEYDPTEAGVGWTFVNSSGIQGNGSAWGAAPAPAGTQTALIQRTSSIAQTISLNAGSYTLSFQVAQRAPYVQPISVTVDGSQIGSLVSPASTSFALVSIPFSVATSAAHTIAFTGTDPDDKTTFIDAVTLATISTASTTTLASSLNPSTVGANVTFTATVTGSAPSGTVGFTDGGNTISGCAAVALPTGSANIKTITCSSANLAAGTHSIVASYGGDAANSGSTSTALSQLVNSVAPPSSVVNPSFEIPALPSGGYQYNPSSAGIGWTFSAGSGIQRNGSAWGAAGAPDGVQTAFVQGTSTISQTLSLNAGSYLLSFKVARRSCCASPYVEPIKVMVDATQIGSLISPASTSFTALSIPFSVAASGVHTLTFAGTDPTDKTTFIDAVTLSSASLAATTTTVASSLNPSSVGAAVTFTATVTGNAPTGSVGFTADGATLSGCGAVALLAGIASNKSVGCSTSSLVAGTHSIVATYSGDLANAGSTSATLSQVVNAGPPAPLVNPSFEVPALPSHGYQYNPSSAGIGWTFSAGSGIQRNGSPWGAAPAPNAVQTAFIQSNTAISQTLSLNAGSYTLSFQVARRSCCVSPFVQPVKVTIDGIQIGGLVSPPGSSFSAISIPFSVATSGPHTLTFAGTDPTDKTTFIDAVTIQ